MPVIKVNLEGDGAWSDLRDLEPNDPKLIQAMGEKAVWSLTILEGGMESGAYSIAIRLDLSDGRHVVAETSWAAFEAAYRTLAAKINSPRFYGGGRWA